MKGYKKLNEQQILKKQFFKYMRYNIIMLLVIFVLFGFFIAFLVSRLTYTSVNVALNNAVNEIKNVVSRVEVDDKFLMEDFPNDDVRNYDIINSINNPNMICIIRDADGKITDVSGFNNNYEGYEDEIEFNEKLIDQTYEVVVGNEYYYKAITLDLSEISPNEEGYIQLLINIDTEKELVYVYNKVIILSVLFGIVISVIASILMSRKTLLPLYDMLKKQNEFVQNVSHELRTPLTIIQAKQELLLRDPEAKIIDKIEDINLTLNETKRLSKITKDLMLLARADSKQMVLQKEEIEIDEFIKNIGKTYEELFEVDNKKLVLNLNYNKMVLVDTNKIYQVIVILLDNALKYTEKGDSVEIATYLKDNKCVIEVKDTGIGISDEAINHIFERFYREDKARSRETGGSGLGLSIADMIVTSHGGTIRASHNGDKGTIFTIRLPR